MTPTVVLLHSPFVGPMTWRPVHTRLAERGYTTRLPSLLTAAQGPAPVVPRIVDTVSEFLTGLPRHPAVILVAHSNAGLFVPALAARAHEHVAGCVFVDAALPARTGEDVPTMPPQLAQPLQDRTVGGLLPVWTDWFDDDATARLFPDAETRTAVAAELPRLPVSYCHEHVPVPHGWDQRPCGYLQFSAVYDAQAHQAGQRNWLVRHLSGQHLHQLVEPAAVTDQLLAMVSELLGSQTE